jgi:hypothetical protein
MRKHTSFALSLLGMLALAAGALFLSTPARAQNISQTAAAGDYSITLKVLPPESFHGAHAEMMRDGGAKADMVMGPGHPNHHLVAFVSKDGKPVEDAKVTISYRKTSPRGSWMMLPVARMHVDGKGLETTHYGNNVTLPPGSYEARVTVNGTAHATFRFTLS